MVNNDLVSDFLKISLENSPGLVTFPIPQDEEFKKDFFDTLDYMIDNSLISSLEVLENKISFKITSKGIKVTQNIY